MQQEGIAMRDRGMEIDLNLRYLEILMNGKSRPGRPSTNGTVGGTIRDAKDNIPEITAVKERLNRLLVLDNDLIERERSSDSLNYKYSRSKEPIPQLENVAA